MNKKLICLCALFGFSALAFAEPSETVTVRKKIRENFDGIQQRFIEAFFKGRPEVEKEHGAKLREYLKVSLPYEAFEKEMIDADKRFAEETGKTTDLDKAYDDKNPGEEQVFVATVLQMAVLEIHEHLIVYQRKEIEKAPLLQELFAMARNFDEEYAISGTQREISQDEFLKAQAPKVELRKGDRIFFFSTDSFSWQQLFGREGYLIVRNEKIWKTLVTRLN